MILFLTGENSFEIEQETKRIVVEFDGVAERIDGSELDIKNLPDLLTSATLFADKRLIVIKNLSDNKTIWPVFFTWLPRVSDDTTLVLIDTKPDKRTVTYKELKKVAKLSEYGAWTDRDDAKAVSWVTEQAKRMEVDLNTKSIQLLVRRIGPDQWGLLHALEKLALLDTISDKIIESVIDSKPSENVFNLFDAALRGDRRRIAEMIKTFELTEDPFRLFALLSGQAFQLATAAVSEPTDSVATDLSVNPYAISKLFSSAKKLGRSGAKKIIAAFAQADDDMKLSRAEPWLLIERALMQIA